MNTYVRPYTHTHFMYMFRGKCVCSSSLGHVIVPFRLSVWFRWFGYLFAMRWGMNKMDDTSLLVYAERVRLPVRHEITYVLTFRVGQDRWNMWCDVNINIAWSDIRCVMFHLFYRVVVNSTRFGVDWWIHLFWKKIDYLLFIKVGNVANLWDEGGKWGEELWIILWNYNYQYILYFIFSKNIFINYCTYTYT